MEFTTFATNWIAANIDLPAVILLMILLLGGWVLYKTQRDPDNNFNFEDMLRDEQGKPSSARLAVFICLAVSTWVVMYMTIATNGQIDTWIFAWYIAVWSGAKVAEQAIVAYSNRTHANTPDQRDTGNQRASTVSPPTSNGNTALGGGSTDNEEALPPEYRR